MTAAADIREGAFDWADPFRLEDALTGEERMVRDAARAYCTDKLVPRARDGFRKEEFDRAIMNEMGAMGFLGPTLPEAYGGASMNHVAYGLVAREIEAIDSGYRSAMSVQMSLVMYPIYEFGSEEQRRKWLPGHGARRADRLLRPHRGGWRLRSRLDAHRGQGSPPAASCSTAPRCGSPTPRWPTWRWSGPSSTASSAASWWSAARRAFRRPKSKTSFHCAPPSLARSRSDDCLVPEDAMLPNVQGLAGPFRLPQQCPLRHRLGRDGCGRILLACGARLHARAQAVRQSARRQPAGPEEACRHADRDRARLGGRAAARPADRRGQAAPPIDLPDEAQQLRQGAGYRPRCPRHAWRQRHLRATTM